MLTGGTSVRISAMISAHSELRRQVGELTLTSELMNTCSSLRTLIRSTFHSSSSICPNLKVARWLGSLQDIFKAAVSLARFSVLSEPESLKISLKTLDPASSYCNCVMFCFEWRRKSANWNAEGLIHHVVKVDSLFWWFKWFFSSF